MLSDEEKKEMLEDAQSPERRRAFARARNAAGCRDLTGPQFVLFLQRSQRLFSRPRPAKNIEGNSFRL